MAVINTDTSKFASTSAEDVASYRGQLTNRMRFGAILAVTVLGVAAIVAPPILIPCLFIMVGLVVYERLSIKRNWADVMQILTQDCDPQKLRQVMLALLESTEKDTERARLKLHAAECLSLLGDTDGAFDEAQEIDFMYVHTPEQISKLKVWTDAAGARGDAELLSQERGLIEAMRPAAKKDELPQIEYALAEADAVAALMAGDGAAAKAQADAMVSRSSTPYDYLRAQAVQAKASALLGDEAAAAEALRYIVEHGGTCAMVEEARTRLKRLGI
ncbi:hypothetical protein [Slackia heliotrinireducens]|uniref:hypothetical protein n=1 Tax=Slackia heliotrinireducens TaxID=84110 RepID=UPI003314AF58